MLLSFPSNLGGVLELPYSRVVPDFASCGLCCADEVSQGFGHILHCVDQHYLYEGAEAVVRGRERGNTQ